MPIDASPVAFTGAVTEELQGAPAEAIGRPMLAVGCVYAGPPDDGERVLRPLRELVPGLILEMGGRIPYTEAQQLLDEEYPRGRRVACPRRRYAVSSLRSVPRPCTNSDR